MVDSILDAVIKVLTDAGLRAFREFPSRAADKKEICVTVGARRCKYLGSGMGEYLGIRAEESGAVTELYGKKLEMELVFDVFSPFGAKPDAGACVRCSDELQALTGFFPSGLRLLEFCSGEVTADEELSAFRCECTAACLAFLIAEDEDGQGEFMDFVLKGVVEGVN